MSAKFHPFHRLDWDQLHTCNVLHTSHLHGHCFLFNFINVFCFYNSHLYYQLSSTWLYHTCCQLHPYSPLSWTNHTKHWKSWKCNAHHYMMERTLTCLMFSAKKPSNNIIENVCIVVKTTVDQRCGWISWHPCPPSITFKIILELSNNLALKKEAEMPSETNRQHAFQDYLWSCDKVSDKSTPRNWVSNFTVEEDSVKLQDGVQPSWWRIESTPKMQTSCGCFLSKIKLELFMILKSLQQNWPHQPHFNPHSWSELTPNMYIQ